MVEMKAKLNPNRADLFRQTCFGPWLDMTETTADPCMLCEFFERQTIADGAEPEEMFFRIGQHTRRFGAEDFCLVTGLRFGDPPADPDVTDGVLSRLFVGVRNLKVEHVLGVYSTIGGENDNLNDLDAVRICLMLVVDMFFLGHTKTMKVSPYVKTAIENMDFWNIYPWGMVIWSYTLKGMYNRLTPGAGTVATTYTTLYGFVFALKVS